MHVELNKLPSFKECDFQICGSRGESQYGELDNRYTCCSRYESNGWNGSYLFSLSHQVQYLTRKCQMQFHHV